MTGRYKQGEENRQKMLDLMNAQPGITTPEIVKATGMKLNTVSNILRNLFVQYGEVTRRKVVFHTGVQAISTYAYTALVTKTRSAEAVTIAVSSNLREHGKLTREERMIRAEQKAIEQERIARANAAPVGVYRHNDPDRMAIPNQGGQGSSRPRMATYMEVNA